MKVWLLFIGMFPLAAASCGCQSGPNCDSLILENFQLQERILALEVQAEERQRMLCEALKQLEEESEKDRGADNKSSSGNGAEPTPAEAPRVELGEPAPAKELEPAPKFDPTGDSSLELNVPEAPGAPKGAAPEAVRPAPLRPREPQDGEAQRLTIDPNLTIGLNESDAPGDEGLVVVLEPRNANGELLAAAGDVEIAAWDADVLDQYPDDPQRAYVAMWRIPAKEVAENLRRTPDGPKLRLQLRWAKNRPQHERLRVFARFHTAAGQTLETRSAGAHCACAHRQPNAGSRRPRRRRDIPCDRFGRRRRGRSRWRSSRWR